MSRQDYELEAEQELAHSTTVKAWYQLRVQNVHDRVSAYDILRRFGVELRYQGEDHEESFSCPFHGQDRKPSARVYPASTDKPSSVWCFVCQERWDCIALWRKFTDETTPFPQALAAIERDYNIQVPEPPRGPVGRQAPAIPEELQRLLDACESRLRLEKTAFEPRAHLALGVLVDRVRWMLLSKRLGTGEGETRLRKVLDKIGEKVRCQG